jgi:hypothetical protein
MKRLCKSSIAYALGTTSMTISVLVLGGYGNFGSRPHARRWFLLAGSNHDPQIPCAPAVALVKRYLRGRLTARGAMPCLGLLGVDGILQAIPGLDLQVVEDWP